MIMISWASPDARPSGEQARRDGKPLSANPYSPYFASHDAWKDGWHAEDAKLTTARAAEKPIHPYESR